MSNKINYKIGEVPLSTFNRFAAAVNKSFEGSPEVDPKLDFELVIGSLFPICYKNVTKELERQYGLGFKAGYEDAKNESKRDN